MFLLGIPVSATLQRESQESVLFHSILKAYPPITQGSSLLMFHVNVCTTEGKITATIKFSTPETTSA